MLPTPGKSYALLADNYELIRKTFGKAGLETSEDGQFDKHPLVAKAQKNDSMVRALLSKYFVAEVFVTGDEYSIITERSSNDLVVRNTSRRFINGKYVMALRTEPVCHRRSGILINKKTH